MSKYPIAQIFANLFPNLSCLHLILINYKEKRTNSRQQTSCYSSTREYTGLSSSSFLKFQVDEQHHNLAQAIHEYYSSTHTKTGLSMTCVLYLLCQMKKKRLVLKQMTLVNVAMGTFDNKHVKVGQILECCQQHLKLLLE